MCEKVSSNRNDQDFSNSDDSSKFLIVMYL